MGYRVNPMQNQSPHPAPPQIQPSNGKGGAVHVKPGYSIGLWMAEEPGIPVDEVLVTGTSGVTLSVPVEFREDVERILRCPIKSFYTRYRTVAQDGGITRLSGPFGQTEMLTIQ